MNVPLGSVHVGATRHNVKYERVHVLRPPRYAGVAEFVENERRHPAVFERRGMLLF